MTCGPTGTLRCSPPSVTNISHSQNTKQILNLQIWKPPKVNRFLDTKITQKENCQSHKIRRISHHVTPGVNQSYGGTAVKTLLQKIYSIFAQFSQVKGSCFTAFRRCTLYPLFSVNAPLYGYLKLVQATLHKKSRNKDVKSPGIELGTSKRKAAH